MSAVSDALHRFAHTQPGAVALAGTRVSLTYGELAGCVEHVAQRLASLKLKVLGVLADNGPAWVVVDLAAQAAEVTLVALPVFFSDAQLRHAIEDAAVEMVITDHPLRLRSLATGSRVFPLGPKLSAITLWEVRFATRRANPRLEGIAKVTYTSGTTGTPKGVCLRQAVIDTVAESLQQVTSMGPSDRHLSVLPLATLLENIGGVYVPLLAGATCCLWPLEQFGSDGASRLEGNATRHALCTSHEPLPSLPRRCSREPGGGAGGTVAAAAGLAFSRRRRGARVAQTP
jgi:long-subunit acyl-CoA synthetase (AMP-forming)